MTHFEQSHAHHYVPQWYQKRFLFPGQGKFFYLDLHPQTIESGGVKYVRKDLLRWGPSGCFFRDDLYTLHFGPKTTDMMERFFFGEVDRRGFYAIPRFAEFSGFDSETTGAFRDLAPYMGAQRFRTPRALDEIRKMVGSDQNLILATLQKIFQAYTTMWSEAVWEIVRARVSPTKFIVSDDPVTFYCKTMFPSEWNYPDDPSLKQIGTRTIFPLGIDSCLILTHLQLARNPWYSPTTFRENARYYDQTLKHMGELQFGRELEEQEVVRINYILKRRATRYVAAAVEDWLYPERYVDFSEWSKLDDDWFLLPHLWKVSFTSKLILGYQDGSSWASDEYGRHPGNPQYRNQRLRDQEWRTRDRAQKEWAKKRLGKAVAKVDERLGRDVGDLMMRKYLEEEGLLKAE